MDFAQVIIHWYQQHKRDLPWRKTKDPYKIWLSEIILQQTRVDQGLSYYHRFINKYPDVKKLAAAKEDEVLKLWQGLGYYSRARNLHHAAKEITSRFNGKFPGQYEEIRSLRGVGDYTAAAIASFAYNLPYAVVDGNVYRVLSRYLGITTPINSTKAKKEFYEAALLLSNFPTTAPSIFNQAIMEFGALQCKPLNPSCNDCPFNNTCFAFATKKVNELPVKTKKGKIRNRYFYYFVIKQQDKIILRKRTENDIWKNLYDFPLVETTKKTSSSKLFKNNQWKKIFGNTRPILSNKSKIVTHQLSHQKIFAKFLELNFKPGIAGKINLKNTKLVKSENAHKYAVPRLIEIYLKQNNYFLEKSFKKI